MKGEPDDAGRRQRCDRFELLAIERRLLFVGLALVSGGRIHDRDRDPADIGRERRARLETAINALLRIEGIGIERACPTDAAAIAFFMVSAHENPRRRFEQQARWREEIRAPDRPSVSERAAGTAD